MSTQESGTPIYSAYRGDPDMDEIVTMFVDELTSRLDEMRSCFGTQDWESLRTIAHQLKGASGGYGFQSLGDAAASLEQMLKSDEIDLDTITREYKSLAELCGRVSA